MANNITSNRHCTHQIITTPRIPCVQECSHGGGTRTSIGYYISTICRWRSSSLSRAPVKDEAYQLRGGSCRWLKTDALSHQVLEVRRMQRNVGPSCGLRVTGLAIFQ